MLTCDIQAPIISITANQQINGQHSFSISFKTDNSSYPMQADVTIYRDGVAILVGTVTSYSYDAAASVMTISGQDKTTYEGSHDGKPNAMIIQEARLPTTVADAIRGVYQQIHGDYTADIVTACPNITCYGYGMYNGNSLSFIERMCNSFGLDYTAGPGGYRITAGGIDIPASPTAYAAAAIGRSVDKSRIISDVYVQRALTVSNRQSLDVKNGNLSSSTTVRLVNPNAVNAPQGAAQFPKDYFLDPWHKCFITIDVPVATVVYSVPVAISAAQKVVYANCTDTLAQPAWRLEVWDGDPGTGAVPAANRLAYLTRGQSWTAQGDETAQYLRIARDIQTDNGAVTTYPTYDGVTIKAYTWPTLDEAQLLPWSAKYSSGDTDGRADLNVISEPMYPSKLSFDQQNLGPQIARRDSVSQVQTLSLPGTPAAALLDGASVTYDGAIYAQPITAVSYAAAAGQEQTTLTGEW